MPKPRAIRRTATFSGSVVLPDGDQVVDVALELDPAGLVLLLGRKAARGKSGRTALAGGLIRARITGRRPARPTD